MTGGGVESVDPGTGLTCVAGVVVVDVSAVGGLVVARVVGDGIVGCGVVDAARGAELEQDATPTIPTSPSMTERLKL